MAIQHNQNAAIPEEAPDYYEVALPVGHENGYEYEEEYTLDLGSGLTESACPTPTPSYFKHPSNPSTSPSTMRHRSIQRQREKEAERDCGICFAPATSPIRTLCCAHLFCAEHIAQWLLGPAADGRCPACRAEIGLDGKGILALGRPALFLIVPRAPPPSRSASPAPSFSSDSALSSSSYASSYASYPTSPSYSDAGSPTSSESEEEDSTDYSLPALLRARALQTRRHTAHPFSSVLGVRGAMASVMRVVGWIVVVGVLAGRGRWV
ncbi:hypothetical protein C8R44DRAFT_771986 [Mycena epipterygia]|nr:hypothetical protein C8R44DRAFT_771986 [Mycena epipterygia]